MFTQIPASRRRFWSCIEGGTWGDIIDVKGDERGPLKVQLRPTGKVTGRLVDEEGRPRPGVPLSLMYERRDSRTGDCWSRSTYGRERLIARADFRSTLSSPDCTISFEAIKPNERNYSLRGEGYLHSPQWTSEAGRDPRLGRHPGQEVGLAGSAAHKKIWHPLDIYGTTSTMKSVDTAFPVGERSPWRTLCPRAASLRP